MDAYKRFLVLMDEQYYPAAGMQSVVASFDTFEEALEMAATKTVPPKGGWSAMNYDYSQVFDCDARTVVWEC